MKGLGLVALLALSALLQSHAQLRPDDCEPLDFFAKPDASGASGKDPAPPALVATDIADSINKFGFNFFRAVLPSSQSGNIIFSPLSIAAAFSLLHIGATNGTRNEIGITLDFVSECSPFLLQDLLEGYKDEDVAQQLSLATRLYLQEMFDVKDDFADVVGENNVEKVNFEDPVEATGQINDWVSEQTNGFIDDLIGPGQLDSSTVMALVNALFFKGTWELRFDPNNTMNDTFFGSNGEAQTEMMTQTQEFRYNMDMQVLELPYVNNRFSMILVLSPEDVEPNLLVDTVADQLAKTLGQPGFTKVETNVTIPRFAFEESHDLTLIMPEVGIEQVFTNEAQLGTISDVPLKVDTAVHKARILVNEEGTTASAATATAITALNLFQTSFTANRPFTFFIRDNDNQLFLFMGAYSNVPT